MMAVLALAAVGFALLVVSLTTGSIVWAWACIAVCVVGAVLLLISALVVRNRAIIELPHSERPARHGRHHK